MKKYLEPGFVVAVIIAVLVVSLWFYLAHRPKPIVTQVTPNTVTVQVPGPITVRTVQEFVTDKTEVTKLLEENKKLKIQVAQLTETLATSVSQGSGPVAVVDASQVPPALVPEHTTETPRTLTQFKDWRLNFVQDGTTAKYSLTQRFEILSTTGKNKAGVPVHLVKLFEIGPGDIRTPITDIKTVALFADATRPHWYIRPHIQAGLAVTQTTIAVRVTGGLVGVQWLAHGGTSAPQDTRYAVLTPVVLVNDTLREFGILPVSYNLGTLPHQPFTNIWISPYLGINVSAKTLTRGGVSITATF